MLQVPKPMDVPFNPSTSCQGAHHVFVVFLLHHLVDGHTYENSLYRCCTAANSRRSFATAANMSEELILSIKFIVLIMVTHNSTLLGTLPPIPTNDSLFELEHPLIPPRCFSASTLEANGWPIQSNGCSIQSFNFVPRSPPCVCCFSSPP